MNNNNNKESSAKFGKWIQDCCACFWNPSPLSRERGMESKGLLTSCADFPKICHIVSQTKLWFKCNFYFALKNCSKEKRGNSYSLHTSYLRSHHQSRAPAPAAPGQCQRVIVAEFETPGQQSSSWHSQRRHSLDTAGGGTTTGAALLQICKPPPRTPPHPALPSPAMDKEKRHLTMQSANK